MLFCAVVSEFVYQTNKLYKTRIRIDVLAGNMSNFRQTPPVIFWITIVLFCFRLMLVTKFAVARISCKIHLDKHDNSKALNEFFVLFSLIFQLP